MLAAWQAGRLGARKRSEAEVIFGQVREDASVEAVALKTIIDSGVTYPFIVAVGSGGCTGFSLLTVAEPSRLVLVDINPAQIHLLRLKAILLSEENIPDLGEAICHDARTAFGLVRERLELSTRNFWDARLHRLDKGLNQCGLIDRRMTQMMALFHRFVQSPKTTDALLNAPSLEQQRQVYDSRWKKGILRLVFRLALSRPALRLVYGPEFVRLAPANLGAIAFNRLEQVFTQIAARNNPYIWQAFVGSYTEQAVTRNALPLYLLPANLPAVRAGLERTEFAVSDMTQVLQNCEPGSVHFVALSNILEGMSASYGRKLLTALTHAMHPAGAAVLRFLLPPPPDWQSWLGPGLCVDDELSADLEARDRSLFCRFIRVIRKVRE